MFLAEWLKKVGFQNGNPFALKQADEEGDLLQAYFVEHPAYVATLDVEQPRSSILHAPRGAGKSTTRRMFEEYCSAHAERLRPLIVRLMDWQPLVERMETGSLQGMDPHIQEIFCQSLLALAQIINLPWLQTPPSPDLQGYLKWICSTHSVYLSPSQRSSFIERGWLIKDSLQSIQAYSMSQLPPAQRLDIFMQVLRGMGFETCYVLIDRVDELLETVADWQIGADLLAPLVGNLRLTEIPGLAFKYFIPSEIVNVLQQRHVLRVDRIGCFSMSWSDPHGQELLQNLLRNRLSVFSEGQIQSLASITVPELRDIDRSLCRLALGSPRHLLNLGEWLFQARAADADDNHLLIEPRHLLAAELQLQAWQDQGMLSPASLRAPQPTKPRDPESIPHPTLQPAITPTETSGVPLLQLKADGSIWRGNSEIKGWQQLPPLQRQLLSYLYENRGKQCHQEDITVQVWKKRRKGPNTDDSLRKLLSRLIAFIEPNPEDPVYIKKISGGFVVLKNTIE